MVRGTILYISYFIAVWRKAIILYIYVCIETGCGYIKWVFIDSHNHIDRYSDFQFINDINSRKPMKIELRC